MMLVLVIVLIIRFRLCRKKFTLIGVDTPYYLCKYYIIITSTNGNIPNKKKL